MERPSLVPVLAFEVRADLFPLAWVPHFDGKAAKCVSVSIRTHLAA